MWKGLYSDGRYKVLWKHTGRAFNTDTGFSGLSEEGFLEEVMSKQKPKGQGGIRREGNAVPGKRKSTCKGPEAREGRFTMVKTQKTPEDVIVLISNLKSFWGSRHGMNESINTNLQAMSS